MERPRRALQRIERHELLAVRKILSHASDDFVKHAHRLGYSQHWTPLDTLFA